MICMNYSIQLVDDPQIIQVTTSGVWDPNVDGAMGIEVMEKVNEWKVGRVLIDMRDLQFNLPVINLFQRAKNLSQQRREFQHVSSKVALLFNSTDRKMDESLAFFETTAQNRGLPYRVFKQLESALEWLAK